jgi:hypothetical protein
MLRLTDFIIDCPDTMELAAFYSEVTGRPVKEGSWPKATSPWMPPCVADRNPGRNALYSAGPRGSRRNRKP